MSGVGWKDLDNDSPGRGLKKPLRREKWMLTRGKIRKLVSAI